LTKPKSTVQPGSSPARIGRAVLALVLILALSGCAAPNSQSNASGPSELPVESAAESTPPILESVVIGLPGTASTQFVPFYIANAQQYYGDTWTVELQYHDAADDVFASLRSGDEQFIVASGAEILQARAQGLDVVAVAPYFINSNIDPMLPEGSTINTVAGLQGHSIGIASKSGEAWLTLMVALDQAGLSPNDVQIVEVTGSPREVLASGAVDALIGYYNTDVTSLGFSGFHFYIFPIDVPLVSLCLATTQGFADDYPEIVSAVVAGMQQGMQTACSNDEQALAISAGYLTDFNADPDTAKNVLGATIYLFGYPDQSISPPFEPDQWSAMTQALQQADLLPADADGNAAYSNAFRSD